MISGFFFAYFPPKSKHLHKLDDNFWGLHIYAI